MKIYLSQKLRGQYLAEKRMLEPGSLEKPPFPEALGNEWPLKSSEKISLSALPSGQSWPKISVVTPSFNQGEFLEKTIRSVLLQGYPNLEYIIIDGGSTDNSVEIIKKYEPWITWWCSEKDDGQSDALSKGFRRATGDVFGWLNSDDVYYPGALQHVASLDWNKADFCYGKGMWIDRGGKSLCLYPTIRPSKYTLNCKCTLCQPTIFFTSRTYSELGELATEYYCAFDYEYWARAIVAGKRFSYIPRLMAQSRMYLENKSLSSINRVRTEGENLRKLHFSPLRLNQLAALIVGFLVTRYTRRQEKKLFVSVNVE